MTIYTSEKILPYVYRCTHKLTGEFYIGSRTTSKQNSPSNIDLPKYRTSSKYVKPLFDEFEWHIVAEFFNPVDAYEFEQQAIKSEFNSPKIINQYYYEGKERFSMILRSHTKETREKISKSHMGKVKTEEHLKKIGATRRGMKFGPYTDEHKLAISLAKRGKKFTEDHKAKLRGPKSESHKQKLKEARRKNPSSATAGKKAIANMRTKERRYVSLELLETYLLDTDWIVCSNRRQIPDII